MNESEEEGKRDRGRSCVGWAKEIKKAFNARSLEPSVAKVKCIDKESRGTL